MSGSSVPSRHWPDDAWDFVRRISDDGKPEELTRSEVIGQAVGAASTCWEHMSGTGVFQSDDAKQIVDRVLEWLDAHQEPLLGLATTENLLREVACRFEMVHYTDDDGEHATRARMLERLTNDIIGQTPPDLLAYSTVRSDNG